MLQYIGKFENQSKSRKIFEFINISSIRKSHRILPNSNTFMYNRKFLIFQVINIFLFYKLLVTDGALQCIR